MTIIIYLNYLYSFGAFYSLFGTLRLSILKLVLFSGHFLDLFLSHYLEYFISQFVESIPLFSLIIFQVVTTFLDFNKDSLNSSIDVAFLRLYSSSEDMWNNILWLFIEVPYIRRSHGVQELSSFVLFLDLTFVKFFSLLLGELFVLSLLSKVKRDSVFDIFLVCTCLETSQ